MVLERAGAAAASTSAADIDSTTLTLGRMPHRSAAGSHARRRRSGALIDGGRDVSIQY
jgi:hypothetical protein